MLPYNKHIGARKRFSSVGPLYPPFLSYPYSLTSIPSFKLSFLCEFSLLPIDRGLKVEVRREGRGFLCHIASEWTFQGAKINLLLAYLLGGFVLKKFMFLLTCLLLPNPLLLSLQMLGCRKVYRTVRRKQNLYDLYLWKAFQR